MKRYECLTTSWFVLRKTPLRGRRFGESPDQEAYCRAKQAFTKARSKNFLLCSRPILEGCYVSRIAISSWVVRRDMYKNEPTCTGRPLLRCTPPRTWNVRTICFSRNVHLDHKQLRHAIETTTLRWSLSFVTPKTQPCPAERDTPNLFRPRSSSHSGSHNSDRNDRSRIENIRIYWARAGLMR